MIGDWLAPPFHSFLSHIKEIFPSSAAFPMSSSVNHTASWSERDLIHQPRSLFSRLRSHSTDPSSFVPDLVKLLLKKYIRKRILKRNSLLIKKLLIQSGGRSERKWHIEGSVWWALWLAGVVALPNVSHINDMYCIFWREWQISSLWFFCHISFRCMQSRHWWLTWA